MTKNYILHNCFISKHQCFLYCSRCISLMHWRSHGIEKNVIQGHQKRLQQ